MTSFVGQIPGYSGRLPSGNIGYRVIMPGDLDVIVDAGGGELSFGELIPLGAQGLEGGLVHGREDTLAGTGQRA